MRERWRGVSCKIVLAHANLVPIDLLTKIIKTQALNLKTLRFVIDFGRFSI